MPGSVFTGLAAVQSAACPATVDFPVAFWPVCTGPKSLNAPGYTPGKAIPRSRSLEFQPEYQVDLIRDRVVNFNESYRTVTNV
jgi:hypothetical protein